VSWVIVIPSLSIKPDAKPTCALGEGDLATLLAVLKLGLYVGPRANHVDDKLVTRSGA